MPYKKSFLVGLLVLVVLTPFVFVSSSLAAFQNLSTTSALDESFSAGYTERSFGESFHRDADAPLELEKGFSDWYLSKGFNFSTIYDTNVFTTRKNQNADWSFIYTPTVGLQRKTDVASFGVSYDLSYIDYLDNDDLDRFNHSIDTIFGLDLNPQGKSLKIDLTNSFKPDTAYAVGERNELRSAEGGRVITYSDVASLKIAYDLSAKTTVTYTQGFTLFYFPEEDNNQKVNSSSSAVHTFTPGFTYKLTPKVDLNGYYSYVRSDYFETGGRFDSDSHVVGAGVAAKITPKTSANLGVDYRTRDYQDESFNGDDAAEVTGALSHKLTDKLRGTIWAAHTLGENVDIQQDASINETKDFFGTNLTWFVTPLVNIDGSASAGFSHRDGIVGFADAQNGTSFRDKIDYHSIENEFYEASIGLNWAPRSYISVFAGYKYFNKNSTFALFEYNDHKTVASVRVKF